MEVQETGIQTDRIATIPNLLSVLRLVGVPLFLWLVLVKEADGWAFVVLIVSGVTDYIDGYIARRWHQISRMGQLLDPLVDRLFIITLIGALAIRELIPWWFAAVLLLRDVMMAGVVWMLKRHGQVGLPVHFLGKSATFALMGGLPLLLLAGGTGTWPMLAGVFGWSASIWGAILYWWAAYLYLNQARRVLALLDDRDAER